MSPAVPTGGVARGEVVPLSNRAVAMVAFRVLYVVVLQLVLIVLHAPDRFDLLAAFGVYLALTSLLSAAVLLSSRAFAVRCFGIALLVDGVFVTYLREVLAHRPGADLGPLALLVAVVLLASFRTGLKLALWLSVLYLVSLRGQESGLFPLTGIGPGDPDGEQRLVIDLLALWLVVVTTAAAAATNERELRRRRYDAEVLASFADRLHLDTRVEEVGLDLARFVVEDLNAEVAVVLRTTQSGIQLLAEAGAGAAPEGATAVDARGRPRPVPLPGGSALLDLPRREDGLALALRLDPALDPWLAARLPGARRIVVADVVHSPTERTSLVVVLGRGGIRVERRTLEALAQAAATASLAWSRAELLVAAERRAATDGLTGLANRRTFDDLLAGLHRDFLGSGRSYALVLTDVDKFKSVNDRYGHQAGDEVLQIVARVLLGHAEAVGATAARYGGEEFAVLLSGATAEQAALLAEQVRLALHDVREPVPVTASFGVAAVPEHCSEPAALIHTSDAALIHAKNTGRDRVVVGAHAMPAAVVSPPAAPVGPAAGDPVVPVPRRRDLRTPSSPEG